MENNETKLLDRFNVFGNQTENRNYNSDYRKIVPQISCPGCEIPEKPANHEKKAIRKYYNSAGLGMFLHFIGVQVGATVVVVIVTLALIIKASGGQAFDTAQLTSMIRNYINNSSTMMAINASLCMLGNFLVFFIGCKATGIETDSLFRTEGLNNRKMIMYIIIALFIQAGGDYLYSLINWLLNMAGIEPYLPDFSTGIADAQPSIRKFGITVLYTCIIAPITEELLIRGFFMKNMARVNQRFGIFASAIMFALIHENIPQGILAFFVGLLMGYVDMKHNSLIPSIVIHLAVNINGMIWSVFSEMSRDTANRAYFIYSCVIGVAGLAMLIVMIAKNRMPKPSKAQKKRSFPIAITSWSLIAITVIHLGMAVLTTFFGDILGG